MKYRADVDGLRALAVLPVVFYHLDIPPFSGGYVGVDIFFVISGYLITGLIREEIEQRKFSIIGFYERRVRRIFPALIAVLLFSSLVASRILMPDQFSEFGSSVFATVFFASNILFWRQSGYFDAPAAEKPLLHTWSLAVEEQFYIVFPLLLFIVHRWLKGRWTLWVGGIALISLAWSVVGVTKWPVATFYLAPPRAWELMIGALLALDAVPPIAHQRLREGFAVLGLGLIACSVVLFSDATTFPGLSALVPCLGAAFIIYAGRSGATGTGVLLSTRPFVGIGLISYSLYLWHWPLIVFAKSWLVDGLTEFDKAAIFAVSLAAATASWAFVEKPFRRRDGVFGRDGLFVAGAAAMGCIAAFGLFGRFTHGWPGRLPEKVVEIAAYADSVDSRQRSCLESQKRKIPVANACVYGAGTIPTYAVWGDSHAAAVMPLISELAQDAGVAVKFIGSGGCPSLLGVNRRDNASCLSHNKEALDYLAHTPEIRTVILISRYVANIYGADYAANPDAQRTPLLTTADGSTIDTDAAESLFARTMPATAKALTDAGKSVVLVYPIPDPGYNVPPTLARLTLQGTDPESVTMPSDFYFKWQHEVLRVLDGIGPSERIVRVYPHEILCEDGHCLVYKDGKPLYRDLTHLSLAGARYVKPEFRRIFESAKAAVSELPAQ